MGTVLSFPQPRDNRAGNIANLHGGRVIPFPEHRSLPSRYQLHGRQADSLNTEITTVHDFWIAVARTWENHVKSFDVSRRLHDSHRGETSCANPAGKNPEDFREPA
jgi:hypothetical protein